MMLAQKGGIQRMQLLLQSLNVHLCMHQLHDEVQIPRNLA